MRTIYAFSSAPNGLFQIIPEQAAIVQEIYRQYISGKSLGGIVDFLLKRDSPHHPAKNVGAGRYWMSCLPPDFLSSAFRAFIFTAFSPCPCSYRFDILENRASSIFPDTLSSDNFYQGGLSKYFYKSLTYLLCNNCRT